VTGYPTPKPGLKAARRIQADCFSSDAVGSKVPIERPDTFIRVSRVGGEMPLLVTDSVRVLTEIWVRSSITGAVGIIEQMCCDSIAAYMNAQGTFVEGAFIRGFGNISGPVDFPDPDVPDMERWQFQGDLLVSTS
jgi:hypothetical protein